MTINMGDELLAALGLRLCEAMYQWRHRAREVLGGSATDQVLAMNVADMFRELDTIADKLAIGKAVGSPPDLPEGVASLMHHRLKTTGQLAPADRVALQASAPDPMAISALIAGAFDQSRINRLAAVRGIGVANVLAEAMRRGFDAMDADIGIKPAT